MDLWQNFRDRDYLRWRRKRRLIRFLLIILTMVLVSPLIAISEIFHIRSNFFFFVMVAYVLFLFAIYRALGLIGRPYIPRETHHE